MSAIESLTDALNELRTAPITHASAIVKIEEARAILLSRRHQCPHCDEDHEPGRCEFRIGGVVCDWVQLAGD